MRVELQIYKWKWKWKWTAFGPKTRGTAKRGDPKVSTSTKTHQLMGGDGLPLLSQPVVKGAAMAKNNSALNFENVYMDTQPSGMTPFTEPTRIDSSAPLDMNIDDNPFRTASGGSFGLPSPGLSGLTPSVFSPMNLNDAVPGETHPAPEQQQQHQHQQQQQHQQLQQQPQPLYLSQSGTPQFNFEQELGELFPTQKSQTPPLPISAYETMDAGSQGFFAQPDPRANDMMSSPRAVGRGSGRIRTTSGSQSVLDMVRSPNQKRAMDLLSDQPKQRNIRLVPGVKSEFIDLSSAPIPNLNVGNSSRTIVPYNPAVAAKQKPPETLSDLLEWVGLPANELEYSTWSDREPKQTNFVPPENVRDITDEQLGIIDLKLLVKLMEKAGYTEDEMQATKTRRRKIKNRNSAKGSANKRRVQMNSIATVNDKLIQVVSGLKSQNDKLQNTNKELIQQMAIAQHEAEKAREERERYQAEINRLADLVKALSQTKISDSSSGGSCKK